MVDIYTGFGQGLDELNKVAVSDQHVLLPKHAGRAYKFDTDGSHYGDNVHFRSIAEEHYGRVQSISMSEHWKGGIYAGAAGLVNLSYMGALKSSAGILYDINPYQKIFWDEMLYVMAETPNVENFKERLPSIIKATYMKVASVDLCARQTQHYTSARRSENDGHPQLRCSGSLEHVLTTLFKDEEVGNKGDVLWLDSYDHLHQMAKNNAIGAITFDVCDMEAGEQLKTFLGEVKTPSYDGDVNCLYISNIFNFLKGDYDWSERVLQKETQTVDNAKFNLSRILNEKSMIISSIRVDRAYWQTSIATALAAGGGDGRKLIELNI